MSHNLNQYLAEVFRNVVKDPIRESSQDKSNQTLQPPMDKSMNHFIVDRKYSLGLDEIV